MDRVLLFPLIGEKNFYRVLYTALFLTFEFLLIFHLVFCLLSSVAPPFYNRRKWLIWRTFYSPWNKMLEKEKTKPKRNFRVSGEEKGRYCTQRPSGLRCMIHHDIWVFILRAGFKSLGSHHNLSLRTPHVTGECFKYKRFKYKLINNYSQPLTLPFALPWPGLTR